MADLVFITLFAASAVGIVGWCVFVMGCVETIKNDFFNNK